MAEIFETLLGKLDLVFEVNFTNNWEITFEQYEELYALNPNLNDEYVTYILDECIKDTKNLLSSSSSAIIWDDDQNNMKSGLNLLSLYIQIPILLLKHDTSLEITLNNIMIAIKSASLYLKLICLDGSQIYNVYQIQIINKIVLMLNSIASIILHFDDAQNPKKSKPHHHASQELVSNKKKSKTIKHSQPTLDLGANSGLSKHHLTLSSESGSSITALFACLNELIESWEYLYTIFPWSKFGCHYGFTMFTKLLTFAFKTLENCGPSLKNLKHNHPTQDMMQNLHDIQKDIKSPQVLWNTLNESIFKVLDASIKDVSAQSPNQDILIFKEQMEKLFFHLLQQMLIKLKGYKSSTINLTSLNQLTFDYLMDLCDRSSGENKARQAVVVQECLYRLCQHLTVASTSPEPGHLEDASAIDSQQCTGKEFYGRLLILVDTRLDNESSIRFRIWLARISKANKTSYKIACADLLHYTMSRQKQFSLQEDPNENLRGITQSVNEREAYYLSPQFLFRIALSSCEDALAGVRNKSISSTIKYLEALSDEEILKQLTLCDLPSTPIAPTDECSGNFSGLPAPSDAGQGSLVSGHMLRCSVQLEKLDLVSNLNQSIKRTENVVKSAITKPTSSHTVLTENSDQTAKGTRSNMISFSDLSKADRLTAYKGPGEGEITFQHLFALLRCRIKQDPKAHVRRVAVEALERLMIRLLLVVQSPSNVAGITNSALLGTLHLATKSNVVAILSTAATSDKSVMVQKQALSSLTTLLSELAKIGLGSNGENCLEGDSKTLPALKRMRASLEKAWIQALLVCSSLAVLQDKCCEIFDRIILRNLKPLPPSKASDQHSYATENDLWLALGILKNFVDLVYPVNTGGDTISSELSQETQPYSVLRNLFSSLLAASIKSRLIAAQTTPPCAISAGPSGSSQSNKTKAQHRITSSKRDGHSKFWRTLVSTLESFVMSPYDKVAWFMLALVCQLKPDLYCPEALFGPKTKSAPPLSTSPVSTFDKLVTNQPYPEATFKTIDVIGHWNWISQAMISSSTPQSQLNFPFQPQPCTMIDVLSVLRCFVTCRCDAIAKNRILSALEAGLEPTKSNGGDLPHNLLACLSSFSWPTFASCSALVETFKALVHVAACSETDNDSSDEAESLVGSSLRKDPSPPPPLYVWQRLSNLLRDVLRTALNNVRTYVLTGSLENQQSDLGGNLPPLDVTKLSKYIFFMGECVLAFPGSLTKSLYNTILCLIIDPNAQPSEGENEDQNFRKSFLSGRQLTRTNYSFQHISRRSEKDLHNDDSSFSSQESSLNLETGEPTSPPKRCGILGESPYRLEMKTPGTKEKNIESQAQPSNLRSHAFLALGKFCLVNESLAKKSLPALIWELDTSRNEMVQNSIMIILMDFIKRYPNATDPHIPVILAICLHPSHSSPLTRYQCLSSFLRLLKEAFVPWNKMLFLKLITLCVDPNPKIRSLASTQLVPFIASVGADGQSKNRRGGANAHHKGSASVGNTNPFYNYFLDTVFFLNAFSPGHNACKRRAEASSNLGKYQALKPENAVFAMPGIENFDKRLTIYNIYLEHLKDDQKFLLTARICSDIFAPIADKSTNFPWDDTMHNILRDAFSVLTSPSIQLSILSTTRKPSLPGAGVGGGGEEEPEEDGVTQDPNTQQRVMEETRKGLVTQILKKNVVENILPILLTLKRFLEKLKSPLLKDLRSYLLWIAKSFPDEVEEVFATQPELAEDMEYHSKRDKILKRMSQNKK